MNQFFCVLALTLFGVQQDGRRGIFDRGLFPAESPDLADRFPGHEPQRRQHGYGSGRHSGIPREAGLKRKALPGFGPKEPSVPVIRKLLAGDFNPTPSLYRHGPVSPVISVPLIIRPVLDHPPLPAHRLTSGRRRRHLGRIRRLCGRRRRLRIGRRRRRRIILYGRRRCYIDRRGSDIYGPGGQQIT